ncbi:17582_t:CDS:1, partial [Gigaspora margarita]
SNNLFVIIIIQYLSISRYRDQLGINTIKDESSALVTIDHSFNINEDGWCIR